MTESMDHRGEAEQLLAGVDAELAEALDAGNRDWLGEPGVAMALHLAARMAQVHATLAAGTPVADEHVRAAATQYAKLRAHVRYLLDRCPQVRDESGEGLGVVLNSHVVDQLRELVK